VIDCDRRVASFFRWNGGPGVIVAMRMDANQYRVVTLPY
jgi:hypothetical protein